VHKYLRSKGSELGGTIHAIGCIEDHVHVVEYALKQHDHHHSKRTIVAMEPSEAEDVGA